MRTRTATRAVESVQYRAIVLAGAAATLASSLLGAPAGTTYAEPSYCGIGDVRLLGYSDALDKKAFGGQTVADLSGLAYDAARDEYYAISDRGAGGDARFFMLSIPVTSERIGAPAVGAVTNLRRPGGSFFGGSDFDGEGIGLRANGEVLVSSEGGASPLLPGPSIRRFSNDGRFIEELPTPPRYFTGASGEGTDNQTWDSLSLSPSGESLFTANEAALTGDGQTADLRSRIRIQRFAAAGSSFERAEQYYYLTEPARSATDLGIAEVEALSDTELLVLERGFVAGQGNTVRVYRVSLSGAEDVSGLGSLSLAGLLPLRKTLLVDLATCPSLGAPIKPGAVQPNTLLDNFEGLAQGPVLADGRRSLILISDDNSGAGQTTRIVALSLPPEAAGYDPAIHPGPVKP